METEVMHITSTNGKVVEIVIIFHSITVLLYF